ncbi:hypothetical protein O181_037604 [Austropuccinia psidii MF-1]|uniref:Integrase catalytic domain-containing protein n=1 Tax=Austropuccinia psidii MF-1 TaxID=1389203 RepID=A0A9Q3HCR7_9BASI|nr:hypothetical protein [Austropuccinia psidii MF-1]
MFKIQDDSRPWDIVHSHWVTGLPPGGYKSYNTFLVSFDRFSKIQIFLPCHKDYTAMDTALLIFNRVLSWTGIYTEIISDRDPKFTLELWKNIHQLSRTKLSFSTAYHPKADGLAERMIQTLEDMTPTILKKGWNPQLPQYSLRKDLVETHPTAASFKEMIKKARKHVVRCMEDTFAYSKDKYDKSHATPGFKVGDLVLAPTTNFNNIK